MRHLATLLVLVTALAASAADRFTYIYRPDVNSRVLHLRGDISALDRVLPKLATGPYLWVRLDRREYVIRDATVLAEVKKTFASLDVFERERRAVARKMKPVEQRAEGLEDQIDALTDRDDDLSAEEEQRLRALEQELRAAERELRPLEAQERELDRREEALEAVAEEALEKIVERAIRMGAAARF
jgi:chromosome segregation ATPase